MNFRVSLVNLLTAAVAAGIVASALWAADNLTIKEPTTPSATVRSDDVGGVHYQGFKIYDGEADSATPLELTPAQDYDTGGGTANLTGFGLLLPASGGPVPGGTVTAPLRVDPTGATAQPVTDNGGSLTVDGPLTDAQLRASAVPVDSELPAGVTPADNQTNAVTIPLVGGFAYVFDGATWDRWTGAVTISGTPTVTANAGSGTFLVGDGAGALTIDGTVSLGAAIPAGTNNIGDVDVLTVPAPLSTAGGGTEATALRVTVANDSTGVLSVDDNGGSLTIDAASLPLPTGAATSANQTTEITALQIIDNLPLADDAAFTVATTNVAAMGCIEATDTMDAGDVGAVKCGSDRELDVDLVSAIPAGTNNIGDVDVLTVPAPLSTTGGGTEATALRVTVANDSTGVLSVDDNGGALTVDNGGTFAVQASQATAANLNAEVQGDAAHDAAVSGNPVLTGGEARTSNGTAVQNGDAVRAQFDVIGRQVTSPYTLYDNVVRGCGNATGTGDTAVIAAAGAGVRNYITTITIVNTSATATYVSVKDGTTVLLEIPAPANNGGAIVPLPVPLRTTANTAFNFASAAGVTTMRVCAAGFTAP